MRTTGPARTHAALKEWGLPYASDSAVTRHLADFLRGRPRVDAVLFNGGALYPRPLHARICRQIGRWQASSPPLVLENPEPDLAVARGAARFGKLLHRKAERIEAGAARAIFLEAHKKRPGNADATPGAPSSASFLAVLPPRRRSRSRISPCSCASIVPCVFRPTPRLVTADAQRATSSIGAPRTSTRCRRWRRSRESPTRRAANPAGRSPSP